MPHIKCNLCVDNVRRGLFCVSAFIFWFSFGSLALWRFGVSLSISKMSFQMSSELSIMHQRIWLMANCQLAKWPKWPKCEVSAADAMLTTTTTTTKTTNEPNKIKGNCKCKWNTKLPSHVGHLEEFYLFINNEKQQLRHAQTKYETLFDSFQKCVNCLNESHLNCAN